jgi:hypothetical protein
MAILNNSNAISTSGGYDINNSLRFRSSASGYLSRTPASAGNRRAWTWSGWIKRGTLGATMYLFGASSTTGDVVRFLSTNDLQFYFNNGSNGDIRTSQLFRDPSAWYHLVFICDTANATASNRMRIYVNGSQITAFQSATYPAQNYDTTFNTAVVHNIAGFSPYLDCYLADVNFIDGAVKLPSDFGETDTTTGSWKPKAYTGTYGTNGFYLKFSDIATTSGSNAGLGKDFSGNTNYWTTNNISVTAGTTYDAMLDSPTLTSATVANYAVMNPLTGASTMTLLDGNLNTSSTAYGVHRYGTIGVSSGKWYWEASPTAMSGASNGMLVGISNDISETGATLVGIRGYLSGNGNKYTGSSGSAYGATWTTNDIIGMALDLDAGTLTFYKNNVSQGTAFTGLTGQWFPLIRTDATVTSFINFGQRPFSYTPPTGFVALNTYNLPDSTIKKGNTVMDATLYTGNGTTTGDSQVVTNAGGFKPDLVWIKSRSAATWNVLTDSVRGTNKTLYSNDTFTEESLTNVMNSFNSNGFTPAYNSTYTSVKTNNNGATYVGWQWQAGQGSTSSNTSGTITSTTSVNATAGFSIVTYTGTGANATVGHGLGVAPKFYMVKTRSTTSNWAGYHVGIASAPTQAIYLNLTNAANVDTSMWNSTAPTSSVFSLGTSGTINTSSSTYVAYCWADVSGFSKAFSYTGNGNADGPMVYLGFRPKFIIIKRTDSTSNWVMFDTSRSTYNLQQADLYANLSDAEATNAIIPDILSNGFKVRTSNATWNTNGGTWIGMAFAENPFKNSLAR